MATRYQIPCTVLPGTAEYFSDEIVANNDYIELHFKSAITINDILLIKSSGEAFQNAKIEILYPNSSTTLVIASSLGADFYLNPPGSATTKLWYDLPARSILRAFFGSGTSAVVKFCAIGSAG